MEVETAPDFEKSMNSINFNMPAESTLGSPSLDVARAIQEDEEHEHHQQEQQQQHIEQQVTEASNLNGEVSQNFGNTIVHTAHIIAHPPSAPPPSPPPPPSVVEEDRTQTLEEHHHHIPHSIYDRLNVHDILPLEVARPRLLNTLLDHFIEYHLISPTEEVQERSAEKTKKRRIDDLEDLPKDVYEGDPNYILPLLFVVNAYETLVSEINARMAEIEGLQGKSIGLALEAAGGLYRRLIEKFPKSGPITSFKRKELASAEEARKRFPHLVGSDEKRVRFIVVQGLQLVERSSTIPPEDAEWFKRVTGRPEAILYPSDYNFFSQRTKARKSSASSGLSQPALLDVLRLSQSHSQESPQSQSPTRVTPQLQTPNSAAMALPVSPPSVQPLRSFNLRHSADVSTPPRHLDLMGHAAHVARQSSAGRGKSPNGQSPFAKFCDECGTQFLRDVSKFCSECGAKRFGVS